MTARAGLVPVRVGIVADAALRRHVLDVEANRLMRLCSRIGKRLNLWFKQMPEMQVSQYVLRTETGPMVLPRLGADGQPIMEPVVPTSDMMETFRWYQTAILGLLKEQRARAAMKPEAKPALTDEQLEAELAELAAEAVRTMPREELERLIEERKVIDVRVEAAPAPPPEHSAVPDVEPMLDFGGDE